MLYDVVDFRDFYDTSLGRMAQRMVRRGIRSIWPDVSGRRVLGLGYATPYLRQFFPEAERVFAFMPASMGVMRWPEDGPGKTTLVDEVELPLPDYSVDRVLLIHGLEGGEYQRELLREVWRVLTGEGRLLVVAPNRRGIWARVDRTPLGWGRPYSRAQLSRLLRDNMFTPLRSGRALYIPPTKSGTLLRSAPAWERIGTRWFSTFAGVVLLEAAKQIYGASLRPGLARIRRPVVVPFPQAMRAGPTGGTG